MTQISTPAATPVSAVHGDYRLHARAFTGLRIFTGLVWLTNGLAKVLNTGHVDVGFFSFTLITLITRGSARSIAAGAAHATGITPLGAFYRDLVLPHRGFFGAFLTVV